MEPPPVRSPSFGPTVVEARHLFVAGALKERRCDEQEQPSLYPIWDSRARYPVNLYPNVWATQSLGTSGLGLVLGAMAKFVTLLPGYSKLRPSNERRDVEG